MAQRLSSLTIRAKVKFGTLHGASIVWIVADKNHSGYPNNSVTLVSDQIIKMMPFDARELTGDNGVQYGNSRYIYSNIRQWMNSAAAANEWYTPQHSADAPPTYSSRNDEFNSYDTRAGFLNGFTVTEQAALLDTTLTVGKPSLYGGGTETCIDKIFLLSCTEVGTTGSFVSGSILPIFNDDNSRLATVTAQCVANSNYTSNPSANSPWYYWLRDPTTWSDSHTYTVANDGTLKWNHAYNGYYGLRPVCNLSGDLMVSDAPDTNGAYTIIPNQPPTMPGTITVPDQILGGSNVDISWGSSTDPDGNLSGYILEQKIDAGAWAQIYKGSARSYSAPVARGHTSVQYRAKAYDAVGTESAYVTSAIRTVINNRAPVISGSDADLGTFSNTPTGAEYIVTDADGDQVTVVEKLDDITLKQYTVTLGVTNTLVISADIWRRLPNGSHAMIITATDPSGASATRTLTFTKAVTSVQFVQVLAMHADEMPIKALLNIQGSFPTGSELKIWICNNGNDAAPAWEEITQKALNGTKHFFTNKTKTSDAWGVKIKVELRRGTATGPCYIQSLGGNFG